MSGGMAGSFRHVPAPPPADGPALPRDPDGPESKAYQPGRTLCCRNRDG